MFSTVCILSAASGVCSTAVAPAMRNADFCITSIANVLKSGFGFGFGTRTLYFYDLPRSGPTGLANLRCRKFFVLNVVMQDSVRTGVGSSSVQRARPFGRVLCLQACLGAHVCICVRVYWGATFAMP